MKPKMPDILKNMNKNKDNKHDVHYMLDFSEDSILPDHDHRILDSAGV
jgi:hypothetical protein